MGLIGSLFSGIFGASSANKAATVQANAATDAARLEKQAADDALNFNKLQYGNSLNLLSPYINTGTASLNRLSYLMGLRPNQGLPPGVVNPNAPPGAPQTQIGAGGGGGTADIVPPRFANGGGTIQANRFSAMQDVNGAQLNPANMPAGMTPGQGGTLPGQNPQTANPSIPNPDVGRFAPGSSSNGLPDPSQFLGDQSPFGPGGMGDITNAGVNASTNQGGTGQVPRTDGGGDPNADGFGSLAQNFNEQFQAPTDVTEQNDPGYQFRLKQGQDAIERSAAARGGLLNTGTTKALSDYNQNAASGEYGNVYNRAASEYERRYNIFKQNQNDLFNRFATLSGLGQTSAGQLNSAGLSTANNAGNILLTSAGQQANQLNNAAAARGSGYVGSANAINGAIGNGSNQLAQLLALMG